jgi:hypothetical protein
MPPFFVQDVDGFLVAKGQSDEAIHTVHAETMEASRSLSSGAQSRDPLTRNGAAKAQLRGR